GACEAARAPAVRRPRRPPGFALRARRRSCQGHLRRAVWPATDRVQGGNQHPHGEPGVLFGEIEPLLRAVQALESCPRVRKTDPVVEAHARVPAQADPVVADLDPDLVLLLARRDLDQPLAAPRADAMLDGVFDERL